ncbi:MAG TPA: cysteine hydrolase [Aliidongia sp.]|nr:cysteine hydrolase [Aliidongia sp.]
MRNMIEGKAVLVVIDIQGCGQMEDPPVPHMSDGKEMHVNAARLIGAARSVNVPVVFIQEAHRPDLVDFGRELDGEERIHAIETDPMTAISDDIGYRPGIDYFIRKRRYSAFFGTDLEILLKGLEAETLILIGALTDVCVHYTFLDAHQNDYFTRVVEDCVVGSSRAAHDASLRAMEYLQTGARRTTAEVLAALEAGGR